MKVVCESCHTRYAISDDKVRGKTFKIKCKKCGAYMVVRAAEGGAAAEAGAPSAFAEALPASSTTEPAPPEPEAPEADAGGAAEEKETRVFNYAEFEKLMAEKGEEGAPAAVVSAGTRAPSGAPEWYLLISEEQAGPLDASDVEARIRRGEVDGDTYVWREGMADWKPLREVESLAGLLTAARAPGVDATREPPPEVAAGASALEAGSRREPPAPDLFGAAERERAPAEPRPRALEPSFDAAPPALDLAPPPASGERKLTGQRHEDSVLFSLKSLGVITFQEGQERPKVVEPAAAGRSDEVVAGKEMRLAVGGSPSTEIPLPPPIVVPPAYRGMSTGVKIAIASGITASVAAVAVVLVFLLREPASPAVPRSVPPAAAAPAPVAAAPVATAGVKPPAAPPGAPGAVQPGGTPPATPGAVQPGGTPPGAPGAVQPGGTPPGAPGAVQPGGTPPATPGAPTGAVAAATPPPAPAVKEEEEEEVVHKGKKRRVRRKKEKKQPAAVVAAAPAAREESPAAPAVASPASEEVVPRREEAPAPAPRTTDREIKDILAGKVPERPAAPARAEAEKPSAPTHAESLPDTLERSQVHGIIRRNTGGIVRCYNSKVADKASKKGMLRVSFTIRGTGRTTGIRVERPDFWGSDLVGCVGNAVARWRFPRFKGEEIEITYPFILGGF